MKERSIDMLFVDFSRCYWEHSRFCIFGLMFYWVLLSRVIGRMGTWQKDMPHSCLAGGGHALFPVDRCTENAGLDSIYGRQAFPVLGLSLIFRIRQSQPGVIAFDCFYRNFFKSADEKSIKIETAEVELTNVKDALPGRICTNVSRPDQILMHAELQSSEAIYRLIVCFGRTATGEVEGKT